MNAAVKMSRIGLCFLAGMLVGFQAGPAFGQKWNLSSRIQAGLEQDNNIFESSRHETESMNGRLLVQMRARKSRKKMLLSADYAGALQIDPVFNSDSKFLNTLNGRAHWRFHEKMILIVNVRGKLKWFLDAPLDFASTWSRFGIQLQLRRGLRCTIGETTSQLDYVHSNYFDQKTRLSTFGISQEFSRSLAGSAEISYGRIAFTRAAYRSAAESALIRNRFEQRDKFLQSKFWLSLGRKNILRLGAEYQKNNSNSFGQGYARWSLSLIGARSLTRQWLLRCALSKQFKDYDEAGQIILQNELDAERTENNFAVFDISYSMSDKLAWLMRLALYENESGLRGRFYEKRQLFLGFELRF